MLTIDAAGDVRHANAAAEALVNRSRAAMLGRPIADFLGLIPPGPPPVIAYDRTLRLPDGRGQPADLLVAALPEREGWQIVALHPHPSPLPAGGPGSAHAGGRAAAGAAAMLAHEIKNPLAGIRGAAQLLEAGLDAEAAGLARLIRDEVDRVAALIDRMEHFADSRPLPLAPQNIHAILSHVRAVVAPSFAGPVSLCEDYDPSLPEVLGDRDAMIQVFLNLVRNAGEALGEGGGRITVTTAYRAGMHRYDAVAERRRALSIEVCVVDEGPGAPPGIADRLFEPFVTAKPAGRGLGLALVGKLVGDMGGLVEYAREGRPPRTVFRVLLARADAQP